MVTSRLNKVLNVTGHGDEQIVDLAYRYNRYDASNEAGPGQVGLSNANLGHWGLHSAINPDVSLGFPVGGWTSAALISQAGLVIRTLILSLLSVAPDGTPQDVPDIPTRWDANIEGLNIRLRPERLPATNYVQWQITRYRGDVLPRANIPDRGLTPVITGNITTEDGKYIRLNVASPVLMGPAFTIGRDDPVLFYIPGITIQQAQRQSTKSVWGFIREQGTTQSVRVVAGFDEVETDEQTATCVFRYDGDLLYGESVTDDKGRMWNVEGSRLVSDRRLIEYELSRPVAVRN